MGYIKDIFLGEYRIFFIECGEKSVFFMSADIFTARDEINLVFAKKVNFLFMLYSTEIQKTQPNFFLGRVSYDFTFAVCLLCLTMDLKVVCT